MLNFSRRVGLNALFACAIFGFSSQSFAQQTFKITAIPDESPTELARKAAPLVKYLEQNFLHNKS